MDAEPIYRPTSSPHSEYRCALAEKGWRVYAYGHRELHSPDGTYYHVHPYQAVSVPGVRGTNPSAPHNDRGVTWHARYHSGAKDGDPTPLGYFASEEEALAACEAARDLAGKADG